MKNSERIFAWCDRLAVALLKSRKPKYLKIQCDMVIKLHKDKQSMRDISEHSGLSIALCNYIIRKEQFIYEELLSKKGQAPDEM